MKGVINPTDRTLTQEETFLLSISDEEQILLPLGPIKNGAIIKIEWTVMWDATSAADGYMFVKVPIPADSYDINFKDQFSIDLEIHHSDTLTVSVKFNSIYNSYTNS